VSVTEETQPYETLASLIERELELVSQRAFDELASLDAARGALLESLPATPPLAAEPALERCRLLEKRVELELLRVRESLLLELGRVRQAQRAAAGYAPREARAVSSISASA
jgi:hypothetical protein